MTLIIWKIFLHWVKNIDSVLENNMAELIQKKKKKIQKKESTRCSVKTLYHLGNELIAQLTKLFTHAMQNRCS